ncbi:hypothetical protein [Candidimonas nitroreducens]|nr:hypothetical protein [Candidimonas nitroreducens]
MAQSVIKSKRPSLDVARMFPQVLDIQDVKLRQMVLDIWQQLWDQSEWNDIGDPPVSAEIPYPNLPHSQSVVAMAIAVADAFEKFHGVHVNRDYLIAAAVLQDASKIVEYAPPGPDGKVRRTAIGKNYGHGFWCAHLGVIKGLPEEITHIILTHSPMATKFPDSLEGKILYYVDQIDVIGIYKDRWKKHILVGK